MKYKLYINDKGYKQMTSKSKVQDHFPTIREYLERKDVNYKKVLIIEDDGKSQFPVGLIYNEEDLLEFEEQHKEENIKVKIMNRKIWR